MNRIAIMGPVASGKTTLARRLGSSLGLPVFDLDDYYWRRSPLPTDEEWATTHAELIGGDQWIISGDYRALADARFQAADAVVWLDLARTKCLVRAATRRVKGGPAPLLDSWRWIWRYAHHGRHETLRALADSHVTSTIYRLRSSDDVVSFLAEMEN